jgi:hypothetical protein
MKGWRESKKFSVNNNTHPVVKREVAAYGELREKNFFDFLHILSISNEHYLSLVLGIYQKF